MSNAAPFLEGKRLVLRALEDNDLDGNYSRWFNDEEVCRFNSHSVYPSTRVQMEAYLNKVRESKTAVVLAIVDKQSEEHLGNISLQDIHLLNQHGELAILIGEKAYWGKGYASEACELMLEYGFRRLNLHSIGCGTADNNVPMQKLAEKIGMKKEGERREVFYKNDEFRSIYEYGILKSEWSSLIAGKD